MELIMVCFRGSLDGNKQSSVAMGDDWLRQCKSEFNEMGKFNEI